MSSSLRFTGWLGWDTLRSRPTLTLLAILLLTLGATVVAALAGARYLLDKTRAELLRGPSVEVELIADNPDVHTAIMSRIEAWPDVADVSYVTPEQLLREIEVETGDSLLFMLGSNPFPPLVRVRFSQYDSQNIDSLIAAARLWPEVAGVTYPQQIWADIDALAARLNRWLWLLAIPLMVIVMGLTGLCLQAQIRNRTTTWEFLALLGMSRVAMQQVYVTQQILIGTVAGLLTCGALQVTVYALEWLLLRQFVLPVLFFLATFVSTVGLAILSGLLSRPVRL